jgi:acyl carrier protein
MERATVIEQLTPVFRKVFNAPDLTITDEMTANDVEGWDSLSHMLLIADVEAAFGIKFKLKELNKMRNVGDMIDIILTKA